MRIGSKSPDGFMAELGDLDARIREKFLAEVRERTRQVPLKVMLADATVTEQVTFDPALVRDYFGTITQNLDGGWTVQDLTAVNNEDVRRIFAKYETRVGNYLISGHMSIQFHVLLYYRTNHRVVEIRKELSEIMDWAKEQEARVADEADRMVASKLKELGYDDLDYEKLFKLFFEDDGLMEKTYGDIHANQDPEFLAMSKRKQELFDELDGLLVETYQTSPVLIDDARLVTGEEGCLCTFDIEHIKNGAGGGNTREGLFDPRKIPDGIKKDIRARLAGFEKLV